jgi:hypothetical protein
MVFSMIAAPVYAETEADCKATLTGQLKVVDAEMTREWRACHEEHECVVQNQHKRFVETQRIVDAYKACRDRALGQTVIRWKPGDPSPVAPDGRRYIMSCSDKVLGLYKPGGAPRDGTEDAPRQLHPERQSMARTRHWRYGGYRSLLRKRNRIVEGIFRGPT